jgi:hypothetical protein
LFPVLIVSEILNHQPFRCKPLLHFPKTCVIWLLDSCPIQSLGFIKTHLLDDNSNTS